MNLKTALRIIRNEPYAMADYRRGPVAQEAAKLLREASESEIVEAERLLDAEEDAWFNS